MDSRPRKFGTQQERSERARRKLLDATIHLVAARGVTDISLADAERHAGLNRGVAAYHFGSTSALLVAVANLLLLAPPQSAERGLPPLLSWMRARSVAIADRQPTALAMLHVAIATWSPGDLSGAQEEYWRTTTAFVEAHLVRGQVLNQVRQDLEPGEAAHVLLGQLHGELIRLLTTQGGSSALFHEFVEKALAPASALSKRRSRPAGPAGSEQRQLFDEH